MNSTWKSNVYFIVNINYFNGNSNLSNFLKSVTLILNLIFTELSLETSRPFPCLMMESPTIIISFFDAEFITLCFSLLFGFLFSLNLTEFAKLRAFRAYVHYVPMCLTCLCSLRAYVPSCLKLLRAYVS